ADDAVQLIERKVDAVVSDAALRKIIGADALAAVARADQALAFAGARRLDPRPLRLEQLGLEQFHRLGFVLVLGFFFLHRHYDAARQVSDANSAFGLVDMLAAGAGGAIDIDAQILVLDIYIHVFGFGKDRDGRRRGMNAALAFRHRHALDAVAAGFEFEFGVSAAAFHFQGRFLDPTQIAFAHG